MSSSFRNRKSAGTKPESNETSATATTNKPKVSKTKICGILVLVLFLMIGVGPFFIPEFIHEAALPERELAASISANSLFIDLLGFDIHYKDVASKGGDKVFILFHGFAAHSFSWRKVVEPLSHHGRVIVFDRIGQGLSSRPLLHDWSSKTSKSPYAPSMQPEFVKELMNKLNINKAVLIGNSAGGSVVLRTALQIPDRVEGIVVACADWTTTGIMPSGKVSWLWNTPQMRKIGTWIAQKLLGESNAEFLIKLGWFDPTKFTNEELDEALKYYKVKNYGAALWEHAAGNEPNTLPDRVKDIKVPALIMGGDSDQVVPWEDAVKLSKLVPNAELVIFKECGHMPQEERPEQFLQEVSKFLGKLPSNK